MATEKWRPNPSSRAVQCLLTCNSNKGVQPRFAYVVSGGSVWTGTRTDGQPDLLSLQPKWSMRGWCHWFSLDRCHNRAGVTGKLPLSFNYATCSGCPSLLTALWGRVSHDSTADSDYTELGRLTTHALPLVCYFLNPIAEQRQGEAHVQPPAVTQENCVDPFLSSTKNLKDKK